jgi:hypothetical protein
MAKDRSLEGTPAMAESTQPGTQVKIKWDDSGMRSVYANVVNAAGTREEIVLLFGMNQAWHSGQKELTVQLSDRVVLSPFAAKRLAILLNNVIRDYEQRFGTLDIEVRRPGEPSA